MIVEKTQEAYHFDIETDVDQLDQVYKTEVGHILVSSVKRPSQARWSVAIYPCSPEGYTAGPWFFHALDVDQSFALEACGLELERSSK